MFISFYLGVYTCTPAPLSLMAWAKTNKGVFLCLLEIACFAMVELRNQSEWDTCNSKCNSFILTDLKTSYVMLASKFFDEDFQFRNENVKEIPKLDRADSVVVRADAGGGEDRRIKEEQAVEEAG